MTKINEVLKKYNIKPYRYTTNGKSTIVDTQIGAFVIKPKQKNNEILNYLRSRSFDYYPKTIGQEDEYEISEYIEEVNYPKEQKMLDLVNLVSLLHSKTTHYKEIDYEDYKQLYEDIKNNIEYLYSYYNDYITLIETKVFMSPSEYVLARNYSRVISALEFSKKEVDVWYGLVKDKNKQRAVVLHNNLDLSHFLKGEKSYFISWDKSKFGNPVFDLYILYKRHAIDFDFSEILNQYEKNYPLQEDERKLFFILIALPTKLDFQKDEYSMTLEISKEMDVIYKTEKLISPYYSKQSVHNE